ncbi:hypothetical protein IGI04_035433, partial [Brassica rapa subsp. trilocularis]
SLSLNRGGRVSVWSTTTTSSTQDSGSNSNSGQCVPSSDILRTICSGLGCERRRILIEILYSLNCVFNVLKQRCFKITKQPDRPISGSPAGDRDLSLRVASRRSRPARSGTPAGDGGQLPLGLQQAIEACTTRPLAGDRPVLLRVASRRLKTVRSGSPAGDRGLRDPGRQRATEACDDKVASTRPVR